MAEKAAFLTVPTPLFYTMATAAIIAITTDTINLMLEWNVLLVSEVSYTNKMLFNQIVHADLESAALLGTNGTNCTNGDIRLVGGTNELEGRVEVCYDNQWGTVCDNSWGTAEANVACGQLGFSKLGKNEHYNAELPSRCCMEAGDFPIYPFRQREIL